MPSVCKVYGHFSRHSYKARTSFYFNALEFLCSCCGLCLKLICETSLAFEITFSDSMAFVKIFCWALIFLLRLRFLPGQSIAYMLPVKARTSFYFNVLEILCSCCGLCLKLICETSLASVSMLPV